MLRALQTFGSAGAGRGMVLQGATNIRLRWSRERNGAAGATNIELQLEPERRYSDATTGSRP